MTWWLARLAVRETVEKIVVPLACAGIAAWAAVRVAETAADAAAKAGEK